MIDKEIMLLNGLDGLGTAQSRLDESDGLNVRLANRDCSILDKIGRNSNRFYNS